MPTFPSFLGEKWALLQLSTQVLSLLEFQLEGDLFFKIGKNRKLSQLRTLAYNCHNLLGVKVVRDGGVTWQPPPARWLAFKSQPSIKKSLVWSYMLTSFKILFAY